MKNFKKLSLLGLLVCLAGCNNGNVSTLGGAVKKGKEITVEEAKQEMEVASKAMNDQDAVSLTMEGGSYNYSLNVEKVIPLGNKTSNFSMKKNIAMDKISLGLGMKGLTSSSSKDVLAYGSASADIDVNGLVEANGVKHSYQTPKGRANLGAYQEGSTTYLDLSDNNLQGTISTIVKEGEIDNDHSFDFTIDKKLAFENTIKDEDMPLLTQQKINRLTYKVSEKIEDIASLGGTVKALKHDDGTYSYSVSAEDLKNAAGFEKEIENDEAFDHDVDEDFGYPSIKPEMTSNFNVNTYSIAFVFDDNGIVSIGATIDVDYTMQKKLTVNGTTFQSDVKMKYSFNGRLDFNYSDKAVIKTVTDKDTYKVVKDMDFEDIFD